MIRGDSNPLTPWSSSAKEQQPRSSKQKAEAGTPVGGEDAAGPYDGGGGGRDLPDSGYSHLGHGMVDHG
jgi:hypothetical protein